jgi:mono/diheme cytochrome c family protein
MFVLELRSYMQDADAGGELDPISRISMHEDRDNDGKYETHKIFVDKLVFPRFVMPYGANAVLTMESNADEVWKFTDTNNDGAADKKELFATGFGRLANVEHQQSGLFWAMDNWFYSTVNAFRARPSVNGGPIRQEPTGGTNAQWGAAMDNYGKVYFQGGASGMPGYFQLPVHYGNFSVPDQFEENLNITWGAPVLIADMQGGLPAVRMPDGSLNRTTAGAGNDVYRGHRLPKDMVGDYFYGETVARIVRRLRPVKADGLTQMRNVYPLSEFIRSTDPLFRPVDMTTAPDGTMYITDMYRGIIQQATWSGRGTYLRRKIEQYQLDKITKHGRIWRLSYEGMERDKTQPRLLNETPAQLVAHLSHPNGWWRDTAQQLLVLEQDKSVVPALQKLAATRAASNQLARIHALWTLEGLDALDASFVREQMKDADPQIRIQAIRASETLYKAGDRSFAADYRAAAKDGDADVAIQAMLTSKLFNLPDLKAIVESAQAANKARGVQVIGTQIVNPAAANAGRGGGGGRGGPPPFTADEAAVIDRGGKVYKELCFTCHGPDGRGAPQDGGAAGTIMAPSLVGSPRVMGHTDYVIKTMLHGMTGPLDGKTYPAGVMMPFGANDDQWVAAIGSYVRNSFGNRASFISAADVARVRASTAARKTLWTPEELAASVPRVMVAQPTWKVTASHNPQAAGAALTFTTWNTGTPQAPGMWFQVELPEAVRLAEIQFESPSGGRGGGGGRGRGAAPESAPGNTLPGNAPPAATPAAGAAPQAAAPPAAPAFPPPPPASPRSYKVEVSMDGTNWGTPIAQGEGKGPSTVITFAPVRAKYVRITQTGTAEPPANWSIQRLRLYEVGETK